LSLDPAIACPAAECPTLTDVGTWKQLSFSVRAPDDAVAATVHVGAQVAAGVVTVDDVSVRVDGPYVVPWISAGFSRDGGLPSAEVPASGVKDTLLSVYAAGAQRFGNTWPLGFDGADVDAVGSAVAMINGLSPDSRERIITDGLPIPGNQLRSFDLLSPNRAFGMEYDDRVLIAVQGLRVVFPTSTYIATFELRKHQCDLYLVADDGTSGDFLGSVGPSGGTFEVSFSQDDPTRTRLVHGECSPF